MRSRKYTMGEKVAQFERALADWMGFEHVVMVNSGSSANLLLIDSLIRRLDMTKAPLKQGDEVLVPALSWPTTVWPLVQLGLKPVFVDIDPKTLAIDLESARSALGDRTRGMFLIHVLGQACNMKPYQDFCNENGITLIEDCCESFGAFNTGRHVGSFGLGGTTSHFFSHQLTTMEGGSIFTNDQALADDLRSLRAHGWLRDRSDKQQLIEKHSGLDPRFLFLMPGYNVRPMEVQAAIGLNQIQKIDGFLDERLSLAKLVFGWTQEYCPWLKLIGSEHLEKPMRRQDRVHSWMTLPFQIADGVSTTVHAVMQILEKSGVECRPIIAGNLVRHPATRSVPHRSAQSLAVADRVLSNGFMIGCHPNVSEASLETLKMALKKLGNLIQ